MRPTFWRVARPLLMRGRLEDVVHIAVVSRHLIRFARDIRTGRGKASFYADRARAKVSAARVA